MLKGLAEFDEITRGELLEKVVLHCFDPVPGGEGEPRASPHSRRELEAIAGLRDVYGIWTTPYTPPVTRTAETSRVRPRR